MFWEVWGNYIQNNKERGDRVLYEPQRLNSYAYSLNNPLVYIDPNGEYGGYYDFQAKINQKFGSYKIDRIELATNKFIDQSSDKWKEVLWNAILTFWWGEIWTKSAISAIWKTSTKSVVKYTNKQYKDMAGKLWFKEKKWEYSHQQKVFYNKDTKKYISWDVDQHNWWIWKMANTVKWLSNKNTRLWTYDKNLKKVGD